MIILTTKTLSCEKCFSYVPFLFYNLLLVEKNNSVLNIQYMGQKHICHNGLHGVQFVLFSVKKQNDPFVRISRRSCKFPEVPLWSQFHIN